jgi:hypothetical protein
MMFVSVLSTSAFAGVPVNDEANKVDLYQEYERDENGKVVLDDEGNPVLADTYGIRRGWAGTSVTQKIVKDTTKAIEKMYQTIAVDKGLFSALTSIDDLLGDIANNMYVNLDGDNVDVRVPDPTDPSGFKTISVTQKSLQDATKSYLRSAVGGEVNDYMKKHSSRFLDSDNNIKPIEYMNEYATALSKALSSEKAAKGLQALMTDVMAINVVKQMKDDYKDYRDEVREWNSNVNGIFFNDAGDWRLDRGFYLNPVNTDVFFNADVQSWHIDDTDPDNPVVVSGWTDENGNTHTWTNADDEEVTLGVGIIDYILGNYNDNGLN